MSSRDLSIFPAEYERADFQPIGWRYEIYSAKPHVARLNLYKDGIRHISPSSSPARLVDVWAHLFRPQLGWGRMSTQQRTQDELPRYHQTDETTTEANDCLDRFITRQSRYDHLIRFATRQTTDIGWENTLRQNVIVYQLLAFTLSLSLGLRRRRHHHLHGGLTCNVAFTLSLSLLLLVYM